jgi:hypothetical protein
MISYRIGNNLAVESLVHLLRATTSGAQRPVDDAGRMATMLKNANLVVTAWVMTYLSELRSLSDFSFATYSNSEEEHFRRVSTGRNLSFVNINVT